MAAASAATDDETLLLQFSSLLQQLAPGAEADRLAALGGEVLRRWHFARAAPPAAPPAPNFAASAAAAAPAAPAAPAAQLSPEQAALLAHADDSVRRALALAAVAARAPPPPPGKAYTNVTLPPEAHARATVAELRTAAEYRVGRPCLAIAHAGRVLDDPLQLLADAGVPLRAHLTLYFTAAALAEESPPLVALHASPVLGGVGVPVSGGGGGSPPPAPAAPSNLYSSHQQQQQQQHQQQQQQQHQQQQPYFQAQQQQPASPLRTQLYQQHPQQHHHSSLQRHSTRAPLEPYASLQQQQRHFSPAAPQQGYLPAPAFAAAHALPLVNAAPPRLLAALAVPQPAAQPQSPSGKQPSKLHVALAAVHARTSPPRTVVMAHGGGGGSAGGSASAGGGMPHSEVSTPPSEAEDLEHPHAHHGGHHGGHHGHHGHHQHDHTPPSPAGSHQQQQQQQQQQAEPPSPDPPPHEDDAQAQQQP